MKVNKYYPFAFIYFFLNAAGLPFGLFYTILLTPLFYIWILIKGKRLIILKFLVIASPFVFIHLLNGVDLFYYARSLAVLFTAYIFGYAFYTLITNYDGVEKLFQKLAVTNFWLTVIALLLVFTSYRSIFWDQGHWSIGNQSWPRLAMLTYEPSYYATLLVPIFAFYLVKLLLDRSSKNAFRQVIIVAVPLVLSLSLGVIGSLLIALALLIFLNVKRFLTSKKLLYSVTTFTIIIAVAFVFLLIFYPDNPIFNRTLLFITGSDQSGRGRTTEAFYLAYKIAELKSIWWGIGPGQLKIIGENIIRVFYNYPPTVTGIGIPNAVAETFVLFGVAGIILRFSIEIFLFFKTNVLSNYYRSILFFYMFIYQFTGSYTTNLAEYVIWILAFTNVFSQFDTRRPQNVKFAIENSI